MSNDNRVQAGVPTGGQFAAQQHSSDTVSLVSPRNITVPIFAELDLDPNLQEDLPQWPANLPEPEVSIEFDDGVHTYVQAGDVGFEVWDRGGDHYNTLRDNFGQEQDVKWSDEDAEAAVEWANAVHDRIDDATYGAMLIATAGSVRQAIVAFATDKPYTPAIAPVYTADELRNSSPKRGVDRAERGMSSWFTKPGSTEDTGEAELHGVLSDLQHWADAQGIDFDRALAAARNLHSNEVDEPAM